VLGLFWDIGKVPGEKFVSGSHSPSPLVALSDPSKVTTLSIFMGSEYSLYLTVVQ
jgi:hypothetical protein